MNRCKAWPGTILLAPFTKASGGNHPRTTRPVDCNSVSSVGADSLHRLCAPYRDLRQKRTLTIGSVPTFTRQLSRVAIRLLGNPSTRAPRLRCIPPGVRSWGPDPHCGRHSKTSSERDFGRSRSTVEITQPPGHGRKTSDRCLSIIPSLLPGTPTYPREATEAAVIFPGRVARALAATNPRPVTPRPLLCRRD